MLLIQTSSSCFSEKDGGVNDLPSKSPRNRELVDDYGVAKHGMYQKSKGLLEIKCFSSNDANGAQRQNRG